MEHMDWTGAALGQVADMPPAGPSSFPSYPLTTLGPKKPGQVHPATIIARILASSFASQRLADRATGGAITIFELTSNWITQWGRASVR